MIHNPYPFTSISFPCGGGGSSAGGTEYTSGAGGSADPTEGEGAAELNIGISKNHSFLTLEKEVARLAELCNLQASQIKNLYEIIDSFQQNFSGQQGRPTIGYWQET